MHACPWKKKWMDQKEKKGRMKHVHEKKWTDPKKKKKKKKKQMHAWTKVDGSMRSHACPLKKEKWTDDACPWKKSGRTQNLSPCTYGWKDEPSHSRVPWSKFKVLLPTGGRTNQATGKCLSTKFKSFYLQVEGQTKSLISVLVEI